MEVEVMAVVVVDLVEEAMEVAVVATITTITIIRQHQEAHLIHQDLSHLEVLNHLIVSLIIHLLQYRSLINRKIILKIMEMDNNSLKIHMLEGLVSLMKKLYNLR